MGTLETITIFIILPHSYTVGKNIKFNWECMDSIRVGTSSS